MSAFRAVFAGLLSAFSSFALVNASGCGTDAEGIEDCRKIEQARCTAGELCGIVSDAESCRRFYRDQCLHGLAAKSPGSPSVTRCVNTIQSAGECARSNREAEIAACPGVTASAPELTRVCDIVVSPEKTAECNFLTPATPLPEASVEAEASPPEAPGNTDAASDAAPE